MRDARIRRHFDTHTERYTAFQAGVTSAIFRDQMGFLRQHSRLGACEMPLVADIGAGSGLWGDELLSAFPRARVVCIDLSAAMLRGSDTAPGKLPVVANATDLPFADTCRFELLNLSTFLHHLIDYRGRAQTIGRICGLLSAIRAGLVAPGGHVLVRELFHESIVRADLASRLFYRISTLQLPPAAARLIRRIGLHSQGAGVCFLTREEWRHAAARSGYQIEATRELPWDDYIGRRLGLLRSGELWLLLTPDRASGSRHTVHTDNG
jgi:SAM-dependent methyltransferase